ncbi:MAG TPA: RNA methyltransferase [Myxococcota bacterium]|nr:RNA methyltransferase [Myxococcota bacterium]HQK50550.1 RNA methyltransferase [Myxococcota bacterium]
MDLRPGTPLAVALVHHPVLDRTGAVVTTAFTSLDLHDIARICRTYDVGPYYLVTPVTAQREMIERILQHWVTGEGYKERHPRVPAMARVRTAPSLDAAVEDFQEVWDRPVLRVVTSARAEGDLTTFPDLRRRIVEETERSWMLVLGTGWGLAPEVMSRAEVRLEPIRGRAGFHHLPVRAALAIMLDRLLGSPV